MPLLTCNFSDVRLPRETFLHNEQDMQFMKKSIIDLGKVPVVPDFAIVKRDGKVPYHVPYLLTKASDGWKTTYLSCWFDSTVALS